MSAGDPLAAAAGAGAVVALVMESTGDQLSEPVKLGLPVPATKDGKPRLATLRVLTMANLVPSVDVHSNALDIDYGGAPSTLVIPVGSYSGPELAAWLEGELTALHPSFTVVFHTRTRALQVEKGAGTAALSFFWTSIGTTASVPLGGSPAGGTQVMAAGAATLDFANAPVLTEDTVIVRVDIPGATHMQRSFGGVSAVPRGFYVSLSRENTGDKHAASRIDGVQQQMWLPPAAIYEYTLTILRLRGPPITTGAHRVTVVLEFDGGQ